MTINDGVRLLVYLIGGHMYVLGRCNLPRLLHGMEKWATSRERCFFAPRHDVLMKLQSGRKQNSSIICGIENYCSIRRDGCSGVDRVFPKGLFDSEDFPPSHAGHANHPSIKSSTQASFQCCRKCNYHRLDGRFWQKTGRANRHVHCVMFWMNNKFKTPAVTSQKTCRTVPVRLHNLITGASPLYDAPDSKCFFSSLLVNSSYSCQNWVQNWVDRMEKYQSQIWRGLNYWICTVE